MSAELQPNGWYKLDFTIEQDGYTFTDALWFSPEQYADISDADTAAMQQARFDAWLAMIQVPTAEDPILEDLMLLPSEG
jgi:hypothetical protein